METHEYLVPDYFSHFRCKMGDCRHACCEGWPVSIDRDRYFALLGADCPAELRRTLDCAMHLQDCPSPERYAFLNHRYDGNCYLRHPDGRCSLQLALGEEAIPDVCRLYPRGIRQDVHGYECSCANSCEAVAEMFWDRKEPLRFERLALPLKPPPHLPLLPADGALGREREVRFVAVSLLQDRRFPLPLRLFLLKERFGELQKAIDEKNTKALDEFLNQDASLELTLPTPGEEELAAGLSLMTELTDLLEQRSESIHGYASELLRLFKASPSPLVLRKEQLRKLEALFPHWERFFEHLLVNHLFFVRFPFQARKENAKEEAEALCVIYALLRFLAVGVCAMHPTKEKMIDLCAAAFRLIDHTDFEHTVFRWIKRTGLDNGPLLNVLLSL